MDLIYKPVKVLEPEKQLWTDENTGINKIIEMLGTRYNCDSHGFKETLFFPEVTGSKNYSQRIN